MLSVSSVTSSISSGVSDSSIPSVSSVNSVSTVSSVCSDSAISVSSVISVCSWFSHSSFSSVSLSEFCVFSSDLPVSVSMCSDPADFSSSWSLSFSCSPVWILTELFSLGLFSSCVCWPFAATSASSISGAAVNVIQAQSSHAIIRFFITFSFRICVHTLFDII